ncbi:hypothetical protein E2F46_09245 [Luteimonas aestuarii]|uniref:Secreted protein n=1 Tax=Luteimonas aestuarii TaxID=453837 RepID=A0A4R5TTV7_9GAMM|nr:hypothetical protein [Luteimonas aestuarii]TDK24454.1 hypothetical protein E2F46_09245 [Luteimonas aestuarii]
MNYLKMLLLGILLAWTFLHATHASETDLDVKARSFAVQAAQIRADLSAGDAYSEISPSDRDTVLGLLARMETMLDASENDIDGLPSDSRVQLFNDQEQVNTILTGARADSRMVCTRTQVTGSHRRQQVCMTVADRERRRARDREDAMQKQRATPCMGQGTGCVLPGL